MTLHYKRLYPKLSLNDIISSGNYALMKAIYKFNPNLNFKFSSYVIPGINHEITKYISSFNTLLECKKKNRLKKLKDYVFPSVISLDKLYYNDKNKIEENKNISEHLIDNKYKKYYSEIINKLDCEEIFKLINKKEKRLLDYIFLKNYNINKVKKIYHITGAEIRLRLKKNT